MPLSEQGKPKPELFCTETNHERFLQKPFSPRTQASFPSNTPQKQQKKTKPEENKTFPKDNLREDSEIFAINSIPDPKKKRKKRESPRAYYFSLLSPV